MKFNEITLKYFVYKRVFSFPLSCFYDLFYEAFSIPVKNERCGEGHKLKFHEQYIELKKIRSEICKKTNLRKFYALNDCFLFFMGKLEVIKIRNVHPKVFPVGSFTLKRKLFFDEP